MSSGTTRSLHTINSSSFNCTYQVWRFFHSVFNILHDIRIHFSVHRPCIVLIARSCYRMEEQLENTLTRISLELIYFLYGTGQIKPETMSWMVNWGKEKKKIYIANSWLQNQTEFIWHMKINVSLRWKTGLQQGNRISMHTGFITILTFNRF